MLDLSPKDEAFRQEVSDWLEKHLIGDFDKYRGVGSPTDEEGWHVRRAWERELSKGGWLGISWPREYGGRGATLVQQIVYELEYARHQAPALVNVQGLDLFGPTLMKFGSADLKARFLPGILAGDDIWGQGFSEPGAGSDLAAIATRAELVDDEWVINGQKVWTTFGHQADWLYLLARTDRESARHQGLTMILIKADAPGVEIRPIKNIAGQGEFSEVFFTDARTPSDLVVGEAGGGWKVAMGLLGIERGTTLLPMQMSFEREVHRIIDAARANGRADDPVIRQKIARALADVHILRATVLRSLAPVIAGKEPGREASMTKVFASEAHQRIAALALEVQGLAGQIIDGELSDVQRGSLLSRAESIYGGTSQIQRNLIGERTLGLPREPRP